MRNAATMFDRITNAAAEVRAPFAGIINRAWHDGNDAGEGFDGEGYERQAMRARCGADLDVVHSGHGRLLAIGDANGPWAVDVTDAIAAALG